MWMNRDGPEVTGGVKAALTLEARGLAVDAERAAKKFKLGRRMHIQAPKVCF